MMSIPYQLLAVLVVALLSGFSGYRFGVGHERGDAALRENETAVATANALHATMARDAAADLAAAKLAAARRAAARAKSHALELELAKDEAAHTCRVSDGTYRLLNDAIARANGTETETSRGDGGVPAAAAVAGIDRGQPGALDHGYLGELRRLPSQSPAPGGMGGQ